MPITPGCTKGACHRHGDCMYTPCLAGPPPVAPPMPSRVITTQGRRQGKTYALLISRIRRIAKGDSINGTYKLNPKDALAAFRADLLVLVGER